MQPPAPSDRTSAVGGHTRAFGTASPLVSGLRGPRRRKTCRHTRIRVVLDRPSCGRSTVNLQVKQSMDRRARLKRAVVTRSLPALGAFPQVNGPFRPIVCPSSAEVRSDPGVTGDCHRCTGGRPQKLARPCPPRGGFSAYRSRGQLLKPGLTRTGPPHDQTGGRHPHPWHVLSRGPRAQIWH